MRHKALSLLSVLSHRNYHWLSSSAWEKDDWEFFAAERSKPLSSLFSPLPFASRHKKYAPISLGRWILHLQDQTPRIWIELQYFPKAMDVLEILVGFPPALSNSEELSEALGYFFSAVFLGTKVDLIRGIFCSEEILRADKFAPYLAEVTHLIPDESGIPRLETQDILKISASQWLEDPAQAGHLQALSYLRLREERQFGGTRGKKAKKKLPLWRKLLDWTKKPGRINA